MFSFCGNSVKKLQWSSMSLFALTDKSSSNICVHVSLGICTLKSVGTTMTQVTAQLLVYVFNHSPWKAENSQYGSTPISCGILTQKPYVRSFSKRNWKLSSLIVISAKSAAVFTQSLPDLGSRHYSAIDLLWKLNSNSTSHSSTVSNHHASTPSPVYGN